MTVAKESMGTVDWASVSAATSTDLARLVRGMSDWQTTLQTYRQSSVRALEAITRTQDSVAVVSSTVSMMPRITSIAEALAPVGRASRELAAAAQAMQRTSLWQQHFARYRAGITAHVVEVLDWASAFHRVRETLNSWPLLLHLAALRVREHILSDQGMDRGPVKMFTRRWLRLHWPATADERHALLDAVIDALLSDEWDTGGSDLVPVALRQTVRALQRSARPVWAGQINGRTIGSLDVEVATGESGGGVSLGSLVPGGHDVEGTVLAAVIEDPRLLDLRLRLGPEAWRVLELHALNGPQLTWPEAAVLAGLPPERGESVRRWISRRRSAVRGLPGIAV